MGRSHVTKRSSSQSCFDGDAWTYVPERYQYYYHYFMKQQPDLNWRNPQVKKAMWNAARFWLDLGADGFRLDALGTIFEDPSLTPHQVPMTMPQLRRVSELAQTPEEKRQIEKYWHDMFKYQWGGPGLHDLMKELRAILDEYDGDRMLVGEDDDIHYMGNGNDELQMVFNFPLMRTERITPSHIRANQEQYMEVVDVEEILREAGIEERTVFYGLEDIVTTNPVWKAFYFIKRNTPPFINFYKFPPKKLHGVLTKVSL